MKIVHFADLHLDARFAWAGASGPAARKRRNALRQVLENIVRLTREEGADALFCAGDLFEHEYVTPDTAAFLRDTFAKLGEIRVFLAPGNHDWYGDDSPYAQTWSNNVHVFREARLVPVSLAPDCTLWGAAHCAPANTGNFLDDFHAPAAGVHVALFHGSEQSWFSEQGERKELHAPFDQAQIEASGLHHAFLGHYHRPQNAKRHTYPGNPDPLEFGEDGRRGAVVATISSDGTICRSRHQVAATQVHDLRFSITGCESRQAILTRLAEQTDGREGVIRITVTGEIATSLDLSEVDLRAALDRFDALQLRYQDLRSAHDFEAIRDEPTVQGQFVADVLDSDLDHQEKRRVLTVGMAALQGRDDLDIL